MHFVASCIPLLPTVKKKKKKFFFRVYTKKKKRERELAVNRRQRSRAFHREKSTVERGGRGSKQGTQEETAKQ